MKKSILLIIALLSALAVTMSACGGEADDTMEEDEYNEGDSQSVGTELDYSDISGAIFSAVTFTDELAEISDTVARTLYIPDAGGDGEIHAYCGTGALSEELVIINASTVSWEDIFAHLTETFTAYRDKQIGIFEKYNADEVVKLKNAVIAVAGDYFIYCVSPDADAVENAISGLTK